MHGRSKKLQDYFTDVKAPKSTRDAVPLLATGQDLLWVIGMRTDERFLPDTGTKQVLVVSVRKNP
jgi:tRNA(Ile)-lysidine synthase